MEANGCTDSHRLYSELIVFYQLNHLGHTSWNDYFILLIDGDAVASLALKFLREKDNIIFATLCYCTTEIKRRLQYCIKGFRSTMLCQQSWSL